jgi:hypothetical protein
MAMVVPAKVGIAHYGSLKTWIADCFDGYDYGDNAE